MSLSITDFQPSSPIYAITALLPRKLHILGDLLEVGAEHLLDACEGEVAAELDGDCGAAEVVDDHAEEPISKFDLVL